MRQDDRQQITIMVAIGAALTFWFALLVAPYASGGLRGIVMAIGSLLENPSHIVWTKDSPKTIVISMLLYAGGIGIYLSTKRNYRKGEEHGSAKWGVSENISRKYVFRRA